MGAEGSKSASDSMFCLERLPCLVCEWVLNKLVITGLGVIEMAMAGRRYNGSIRFNLKIKTRTLIQLFHTQVLESP